MVMSPVPSPLLLAAGLLASPALGELAGLRGSLKASLAEEDDRAAFRELQSQVDLVFSMLPEPEFAELPDIVPGRKIELPEGAIVTQREDINEKEVFTSSRKRDEENLVVKFTDGSPAAAYERPAVKKDAARAGAVQGGVATHQDSLGIFANWKRDKTLEAGEVSNRGINFDRFNKNEYTIEEGKSGGRGFEQQVNKESTWTDSYRDGNGGSGWSSNSKIEFGDMAQEGGSEFTLHDQDGPLLQYYYNSRMSMAYTELENNLHVYDFEYSISLP